MTNRRVHSSGPAETEAAAARLAPLLRAGDTLGLIGSLGAGKTRFVQGLARALGVPPSVRVTSPTFTIVNELRGGRVPLHHVDLYRIECEAELDHIGLDDLWRTGAGIVAVEWCDRFPVLPIDHLQIRIEVLGETERALVAEGTGPRGAELAAAWVGAATPG